MANTLIPIQTHTLTGTAASVTFSDIPQYYTDLKIVVSARNDRGSQGPGYLQIKLNDSTSNFTSKHIANSSDTPTSVSSASRTDNYASWSLGTGYATTATFNNSEFYFVDYTSSSNKTFSGQSVNENNGSWSLLDEFAFVWADTSAITKIELIAASQNFVSGSTFTLYGVSNGVKATGGTLTVAGGYAYHTFTSTGSFLPTQKIKNAEVLIIAGGGGGGNDTGGGGGAGGVVYGTSQTFLAGSSVVALVGSGGSAANSGSNSVFGSSATPAIGGGRGGNAGVVGTAGGCGGGGSYHYAAGGAATQTLSGTNFTAYGTAGGAGGTGGGYGMGGGGGAGGAGGNGSTDAGGNGGVGANLFSSWGAITSTGHVINSVYYFAGGGGGGAYASGGGYAGAGGFGGGGAGSSSNSSAGSAATANTGGGGGGAGGGGGGSAGAGGSGIIIVRYPL